MKQKILLTFFLASLVGVTQAQKKPQSVTAYAITATQKGSSAWTEVRLIDINTGEEVQSIYQSSKEVPVLNARTGKPVLKTEPTVQTFSAAPTEIRKIIKIEGKELTVLRSNLVEAPAVAGFGAGAASTNKVRLGQSALAGADNSPLVVINGRPMSEGAASAAGGDADDKSRVRENILLSVNPDDIKTMTVLKGATAVALYGSRASNGAILITTKGGAKDGTTARDIEIEGRKTPGGEQPRAIRVVRRHVEQFDAVQSHKPFATNSAAAAYDKKHDRLYYTPVGINQLRYIDLKSKTSSVYFFEDEKFGALAGRFDVPNQITRMVIAADGNGYALTNNGEHLIKFTTNKKAEVTDLGSLKDHAENKQYSIHSRSVYGGDMIAGESGDLYLIAANRSVFDINVKNMTAKYLGSITGLPKNYSTNGAVADKDQDIIVSSAQSTAGYYRFNLKTLQAEKVSTAENVFNASDLANGNLLKDRSKNKDEQKPTEAQQPVANRLDVRESLQKYKMSVYPNPATNGIVNLLFADYPTGRYQVQFMDASGKIFNAQNVNINVRNQVQQFKLPQLMGKGNYLVKIVGGEAKSVLGIEQLVVQ